MKKIFMLFISTFLIGAVIGQSALKDLRDYAKPHQQSPYKFSLKDRSQLAVTNQFQNYWHKRPVQKERMAFRDSKMALDSITFVNTNEADMNTKSIFTYDAYGNNTQHTQYDWDDELSEWYKSYERNYSYDASGNLTQLIEMVYDDWDDEWYGYENSTFIYDNEGVLIKAKNKFWDEETGDWYNGSETVFTYNPDGTLTETLMSIWQEDQLVAYTKREYDYNNDQSLSQVFQYEMEGTEWTTVIKEDYSYDENGNLIEMLMSSYFFGDWYAGLKYLYAYDNQNRITSQTEMWYDILEEEWTILFLTDYIYDNQGNVYEMVITDVDWEEKSKSEFNYNNDYSYDELLLPNLYDSEFSELFNHMLTDSKEYDWDFVTEQWIHYGDATFYYSDHTTTSTITTRTDEFEMYPNPATNWVTIDIAGGEAQFDLFDINGKLVITEVVSGKQQISVNHLNKGLYVYKIMQNGKTSNGKMLIE